MAAAIRERFGVEAELVKGDSGVFDVIADGRLVFSKDEKGRFPNSPEEVLALLAGAPKA